MTGHKTNLIYRSKDCEPHHTLSSLSCFLKSEYLETLLIDQSLTCKRFLISSLKNSVILYRSSEGSRLKLYYFSLVSTASTFITSTLLLIDLPFSLSTVVTFNFKRILSYFGVGKSKSFDIVLYLNALAKSVKCLILYL